MSGSCPDLHLGCTGFQLEHNLSLLYSCSYAALSTLVRTSSPSTLNHLNCISCVSLFQSSGEKLGLSRALNWVHNIYISQLSCKIALCFWIGKWSWGCSFLQRVIPQSGGSWGWKTTQEFPPALKILDHPVFMVVKKKKQAIELACKYRMSCISFWTII